MTTTRDKARAMTLALRLDGPETVCAAWIDSRDAQCGKPAEAWLCKRHTTVGEKRLAVKLERDRARMEKVAAERERTRPRDEARLARIEARLDQIDPDRRDDRKDMAAVNLPLAKRLPSDTRIHELATLHREAEKLRERLGVTA